MEADLAIDATVPICDRDGRRISFGSRDLDAFIESRGNETCPGGGCGNFAGPSAGQHSNRSCCGKAREFGRHFRKDVIADCTWRATSGEDGADRLAPRRALPGQFPERSLLGRMAGQCDIALRC